MYGVGLGEEVELVTCSGDGGGWGGGGGGARLIKGCW